MQSSINRVEMAIEQLKLGKMIILVDHPDRENEGDIIVAAELISNETMNFMIRYCSGIVCLSMASDLVNKLSLPLMVSENDNSCSKSTAFTVSIDAKNGTSTGVSSADRATTVLTAIDDNASIDDLITPGHVFPLKARKNGVLERCGHTEGSVDLMKIAGLKQAAVICEIMNEDGTMTRGKQLDEFAKQHDILQVSIDDIIQYRLMNECFFQEETTAVLPTKQYGNLEITIIKDTLEQQEHTIISNSAIDNNQPPLVRIHSSCITGDLFGSLRCDCHDQLHYALERISKEGGYLIYLNQEGRGIGLLNKIKAYALQENGLDTVEANLELGLAPDMRSYQLAASLIRYLGLNSIRLLTNNPDKINQLLTFGCQQVIREEMPVFNNCHNEKYLTTKKLKLNHQINFESIIDKKSA